MCGFNSFLSTSHQIFHSVQDSIFLCKRFNVFFHTLCFFSSPFSNPLALFHIHLKNWNHSPFVWLSIYVQVYHHHIIDILMLKLLLRQRQCLLMWKLCIFFNLPIKKKSVYHFLYLATQIFMIYLTTACKVTDSVLRFNLSKHKYNIQKNFYKANFDKQKLSSTSMNKKNPNSPEVI